MIGSDTSGLEVAQSVDQLPSRNSFVPVHHYLIPTQGVPDLLKYHNQEELAKDKVYKFAYCLGVNKFKGAGGRNGAPSARDRLRALRSSGPGADHRPGAVSWRLSGSRRNRVW